jgi:predicted amidohydrolase YtcJ
MQFGITSVQNMSMPVSVARLVDLYSAAPTPIRQRIMHFRRTDSKGPIRGESDGQRPGLSPLIAVSGIKWVLDGTPIERTAALRAPYADVPTTSGWMNFTQADMQAMLLESADRHQQLLMHIIGDKTTETFLDAMDATGGPRKWAGKRVRIEHGCGLAPDLLARARALGVLVVLDPVHLDFGVALEKRWGPVRTRQFEPVKSLLRAGIPLALGSDGLLNPFANIMFAVMHPMRPKEGLTREQAVIAYTRTSAYAEFAEQDKGSLEPGKLADLAVLSQDIFTVPLEQLPSTESVLTMVGGAVVYEKPGN